MKRKVAGMLIGLLLVCFASGAVYAEKSQGKKIPVVKTEKCDHEEGGPRMGFMRHRGMERMRARHRLWHALKGLDLDANQKEAIRGIMSTTRKDAIKKIADIRVARIELREVLANDQVDMGAAEAKLKQIESLRTDLHMSRIKAMQEIKEKLTPDQRQKFKQNLRKRFGNMADRRMKERE